MFVAPDPGHARLRFAARALLGISAAVAVITLAGFAAPAACAGGLAALLAFFTVADPTVRRQAVTTALLPAVGLPVLALAACLHQHPLPRDAAFVAVVGAGVHARRWGARGHALGVFGFMMFFVAQFLHAVPGDLPELTGALAIGLGCAVTVRFGLWCHERGSVPPPAVDLPQPRGLSRPTTRQAVQAATAAAAALALGQAVSADRWYWAVAATWWIFVNTASRGETLVRGFRRVLGTATGIAAGFALAIPLHGATVPSLVLVGACVFGIFYSAQVSYSWMTFFVTVMAGSLYGLLGVLHPGLLVLRLEETGAGALTAALAVVFVLPVTTHAATDAWIQRALHAVREAAAGLEDGHGAAVAVRAAELDLVLGRVRASVAPLVHPLSPLKARRARARRVLELLDACAHQVRGLAETAAHPGAGQDERLRAATRRVEEAVLRLVTPGAAATATSQPPAAVAPAPCPRADRALAHLHGLETALADLAAPLQAGPRSAALAA